MDLIKILLTQDADMGYGTEAEQSQKEKDEKENAEKLKVLLDINDEKVNIKFRYILLIPIIV